MKKSKKKFYRKLCLVLSLVLILPSLCLSSITVSATVDPYIQDTLTYNIKNVMSGQYLDLYNGSTANGTNVIQNKYSGNSSQRWRAIYLGGGMYKIVSSLDHTKALTVAGSSGANGLNIYISTFTNSVTQRFSIERKTDYTCKVLSNASNYIGGMTVQAPVFDEGANVYQMTYNGTHNDEWLFEIYSPAYYKSEGIRYATANYDNYLNTYPNLEDWGGDCANFVSQCLAAGGKRYSGNWHIYKKNNTYLAPSSVSQLNHTWELCQPYTSPWISAEEFGSYWSAITTTDSFTPQQIINNNSATATAYGTGDVVQLLKRDSIWDNYYPYHTMYVTDVIDPNDKSTFKMTFHTENTLNYRLRFICIGKDSNYYLVRFYKIV